MTGGAPPELLDRPTTAASREPIDLTPEASPDEHVDFPVTIIEPRKGWRVLELDELWRYRHLLTVFLWRDIKVSHKQTVLGMAWILVSPLVTVAVYTVVFGRMFEFPSGGYPYPLLVFSGQYLWGAFSAALAATTGSVVGNTIFIQKIYFPRLLLPASAALSGMPNLGLVLLSLLAVMGGYGYWPSPAVILAPVIGLLVLGAALGIGMLLAPLNVMYRDVGRLVGFAVQLGFFLTPVLYPISEVPETLRPFLALNPVVGYISALRWCLYGAPLHLDLVASSLLMTTVFLVAGAFCYTRFQGRFADVI